MEKEITYSQWLDFVRKARNGGLESEDLEELKSCCPRNLMPEYESIMLNELIILETILIKKTIKKFQNIVNTSVEECDLEAIQFGIREFKSNVSKCFFFESIGGYPVLIKKELGMQLVEKYEAFIDEYMNFVKKTSECGGDLFFDEFGYICKKAKLKNFIQGYRDNVKLFASKKRID